MKALKCILIVALIALVAGGEMKADEFESRLRDGVAAFTSDIEPRYDLGGIAENYNSIGKKESYLNLASLVGSDPAKAARLLDKLEGEKEKFAVIYGAWSASEESYIAFWKEASQMDIGEELIEFGVLPVRGWNSYVFSVRHNEDDILMLLDRLLNKVKGNENAMAKIKAMQVGMLKRPEKMKRPEPIFQEDNEPHSTPTKASSATPEPTLAKKPTTTPEKKLIELEASDAEADSNLFPYWTFLIGGVVVAGLLVVLRRKWYEPGKRVKGVGR